MINRRNMGLFAVKEHSQFYIMHACNLCTQHKIARYTTHAPVHAYTQPVTSRYPIARNCTHATRVPRRFSCAQRESKVDRNSHERAFLLPTFEDVPYFESLEVWNFLQLSPSTKPQWPPEICFARAAYAYSTSS
jgi:hypothetical protein